MISKKATRYAKSAKCRAAELVAHPDILASQAADRVIWYPTLKAASEKGIPVSAISSRALPTWLKAEISKIGIKAWLAKIDPEKGEIMRVRNGKRSTILRGKI